MEKEQLERFCELVNGRWPGCEIVFDVGANIFVNGSYLLSFSLAESDFANAEFIIWGLDRLAELVRQHFAEQIGSVEFGVDLIGETASNQQYFVEVTVYPENDSYAPATVYPAASTRAQAVFLALLQALESTTQPPALEKHTGNPATQTPIQTKCNAKNEDSRDV